MKFNIKSEQFRKYIEMFLPSLISLILLILGIIFDNLENLEWFTPSFRLVWYLIAYFPVGIPVLKSAFKTIQKGDYFSEFFLMSIATLGAFSISEYPEGVAVMLFYTIGENFQSLAVKRAKTDIKKLIDQRPDQVTLIYPHKTQTINAKDAKIGDIIQLKSGEKLALDGKLIGEFATFNTAALTGESLPQRKKKDEEVLAGMINLNTVAQIEVTAKYTDSKLSKIVELVQNASAQKAQTELFIRKFAKIYTPIVVFLALLIIVLPYFWTANYVFNDWLYRGLIFLVISCPCALVISIPLGYFGGIGAASKNGILFKGGNFLDQIANINNLVFDKTGTLTEGEFKVQKVHIEKDFDSKKIEGLVKKLESFSSHPIAIALNEFLTKENQDFELTNIEEFSGFGMKGMYKNKTLLVGNFRLLDKFLVNYNAEIHDEISTVIAIAFDQIYAGYFLISDKIKPEAKSTIEAINRLGTKTTVLSGDKNSAVQNVAKVLGIGSAFGDLLPIDKVNKIKEMKTKNTLVAFVGDGVNDAPVVAISDVGIAMGGLGSDATIETADVVIQNDNLGKILQAINIGKNTKTIVWQNIFLAFTVKALVLILGVSGLANMWEAVFADVGVALLAILNAVRIQKIHYD